MKKYMEAIEQNIEKLIKVEPTPERARYMHDLLCVKKYLMKHAEEMMGEHMDNPRPMAGSAAKNPY